MVTSGERRRNEVAVQPPEPSAAGLVFIGVIRTPWTSPRDCPHGGREDGPVCRIEVSEPWVPALDGIEDFERIEVLYWLHQARRDLVRQSPGNDGKTRGSSACAHRFARTRSAYPLSGSWHGTGRPSTSAGSTAWMARHSSI